MIFYTNADCNVSGNYGCNVEYSQWGNFNLKFLFVCLFVCLFACVFFFAGVANFEGVMQIGTTKSKENINDPFCVICILKKKQQQKIVNKKKTVGWIAVGCVSIDGILFYAFSQSLLTQMRLQTEYNTKILQKSLQEQMLCTIIAMLSGWLSCLCVLFSVCFVLFCKLFDPPSMFFAKRKNMNKNACSEAIVFLFLFPFFSLDTDHHSIHKKKDP